MVKLSKLSDSADTYPISPIIPETVVHQTRMVQDYNFEPFLIEDRHNKVMKAIPISRGCGSLNCADLVSSTAVLGSCH